MAGTRWTFRRTIAVALIVGVCWMVYRCVTDSLEAERNLHATLFTIRLVQQFVAERGQWPESWEELESFSTALDLQGTSWPSASAEVQGRVAIEFLVDAGEVAEQDPMTFTAIQPIGPYYEYRDYPPVALLQTTIRESISRADAQ